MSRITRRDFMGGVALMTGAGAILSPLEALAQGVLPSAQAAGHYPPALQGIRGATDEMVEVGHGIAWEGKEYRDPLDLAQEGVYDLVVVGAGISGLAAAWFYRKQMGPEARILILENHDDIGGHARRMEFEVDGRTILAQAGSQLISGAALFDGCVKEFFDDIGLDDFDRLASLLDTEFERRHGLTPSVYMSGPDGQRRAYADPLELSTFYPRSEPLSWDEMQARIEALPLSATARADYVRLLAESTAPFPGLDARARVERLATLSYTDYLKAEQGIGAELADFLRMAMSMHGLPWDSVSALHAARSGLPGFGEVDYLALASEFGPYASQYTEEALRSALSGESYYNYEFPDGNASPVRMAVRKLIPSVAPGSTMDDIVSARFDYSQLDRENNAVRIRLSSTVIDARNDADGEHVAVTYVRGGKPYRVRGRHAVMACWNHILPHICPEMGEEQRAAFEVQEKFGFAMVTVALRDWKALKSAGVGPFWSPDGFYWFCNPAPQVAIGDNTTVQGTDDPISLRLYYSAIEDDPSLDEREKIRRGRYKLFAHTLEDFEVEARKVLNDIYGASGFDWDRDVAGFVVHRWPHGPAYMYNSLYDPLDWTLQNGPHLTARQRIGRISIANSDSEAEGLFQYGIVAGHRAVMEQLDETTTQGPDEG